MKTITVPPNINKIINLSGHTHAHYVVLAAAWIARDRKIAPAAALRLLETGELNFDDVLEHMIEDRQKVPVLRG